MSKGAVKPASKGGAAVKEAPKAAPKVIPAAKKQDPKKGKKK